MFVESKNYRSVGYGLGVHPNRPQAVPNRRSDNFSIPLECLFGIPDYRFGWASVFGVQVLLARFLYDILKVLVGGGLDHPPSAFFQWIVETLIEQTDKQTSMI
jgi:hypothetical protein